MDSKFQIGDRVRLSHDVTHLANVCVEKGSLGTVVWTGDAEVFSVRLDQHVAGLEDWSNELLWSYDDSPDDFLELAGLFLPINGHEAQRLHDLLTTLASIDEGEYVSLDEIHSFTNMIQAAAGGMRGFEAQEQRA